MNPPPKKTAGLKKSNKKRVHNVWLYVYEKSRPTCQPIALLHSLPHTIKANLSTGFVVFGWKMGVKTDNILNGAAGRLHQ